MKNNISYNPYFTIVLYKMINNSNISSIKSKEMMVILGTNEIKEFHKNGNVKEVGLLIDKKIGLLEDYNEDGNLINAFSLF